MYKYFQSEEDMLVYWRTDGKTINVYYADEPVGWEPSFTAVEDLDRVVRRGEVKEISYDPTQYTDV